MNVILISTGKRHSLLAQSILSLLTNASDWSKHTLTIVMDNPNKHEQTFPPVGPHFRDNGRYATVISPATQLGASGARNTGASSIPKYERHSHLMFVDDDCYFAPGWDTAIEQVIDSESVLSPIVSSHAHPFNHTVIIDKPTHIFTNVISTVHMVIPWKVWDRIGYFALPGGPGGSEDVDYCKRTTDMGYPLAITKPHYVLHTGVHSSNGTPIVGSELVMERNRELEHIHGIVGKVRYA